MSFYDIRQVKYNLNEIEESIYHWKINNIVTYISSLIYHDDNNISFQIDINNIIYKFSLTNNINNWELSFIKLDQISTIITKIVDILDIINNDIQKLPNPKNLNKILDIIEFKIDETDFN